MEDGHPILVWLVCKSQFGVAIDLLPVRHDGFYQLDYNVAAIVLQYTIFAAAGDRI